MDVSTDLLLLGQLPGLLAVALITTSCTSVPTTPPKSGDDNGTDEADRIRSIFTYLLLAVYSAARLLATILFTIARNWPLLLSLFLVAGVTLLQNQTDSIILRETDSVYTELWPPIFEIVDIIAVAIRLLAHTFLTLTNYINGLAKLIFFTLGTLTLECEFYSVTDSVLQLALFARDLAISLAEFIIALGLEDLDITTPLSRLQGFLDSFRGPVTKCWCNDIAGILNVLFDVVVSSSLRDALWAVVNFFLSYTRTVILFVPRFIGRLIECISLDGQEQANCLFFLEPRIDDIVDKMQLFGIHLSDWIDVVTNSIFDNIDDAVSDPDACCFECIHFNGTVLDTLCLDQKEDDTCPDVPTFFCGEDLFPNGRVFLHQTAAPCVSSVECPGIPEQSARFPNISRLLRAPGAATFAFGKTAGRLPMIKGFKGVFLFDTVMMDWARNLFHMLTHPQSFLQRGYVSNIIDLDKTWGHMYNTSTGVATFFNAFANEPTADLGCVLAETINITNAFTEILVRIPFTLVTLDPWPLEFLRENATRIADGIIRDSEDLALCAERVITALFEAIEGDEGVNGTSQTDRESTPGFSAVSGQVVREAVYLSQNMTRIVQDIVGQFESTEVLLEFLLSRAFREDLDTVTFTLDNFFIALGNLLRQYTYTPDVTCELRDPRTRPEDGARASLAVDPLCCAGGYIDTIGRFVNNVLRTMIQTSLEVIDAEGDLDTDAINRIFLNANAPLNWKDNLIPLLDDMSFTGACTVPSILSLVPCPQDESISIGAAMSAVASSLNNVTGPLPYVFASAITRFLDTVFNVYALAATDQCSSASTLLTNCICPPLVMLYDFTVGNFFFVLRNILALVGCFIPGEVGEEIIETGEFFWALFGWDDEDSLHFLLCDTLEFLGDVIEAIYLLFTDPGAFFELLGEQLAEFILELIEPLIEIGEDVVACIDVMITYINSAYQFLRDVFRTGAFWGQCLGFIEDFIDSCFEPVATCDFGLLSFDGCRSSPFSPNIDTSDCPLFTQSDELPTFGACCENDQCDSCLENITNVVCGSFLGPNTTCPEDLTLRTTCCFPGNGVCDFCTEGLHPALCDASEGAINLGTNATCPPGPFGRPLFSSKASLSRHVFNVTNMWDPTFAVTDTRSPCHVFALDLMTVHHSNYLESRSEIDRLLGLEQKNMNVNQRRIVELLAEMQEPTYSATEMLLRERFHTCVHSFQVTRALDALVGVPDPRMHVFPPLMFTNAWELSSGFLKVVSEMFAAVSYSAEYQLNKQREHTHRHNVTGFLLADKGLDLHEDYGVIHWTKWWNHVGRGASPRSGHMGARAMRISQAVISHWNRTKNFGSTRVNHNRTILEGVTESLHMMHSGMRYGLEYVTNSTDRMLRNAQAFSDRMSHLSTVVSHRHAQHRARVQNQEMPKAPWRLQESAAPMSFSTSRSLLQHAVCENNTDFTEIPPLDFGSVDCKLIEVMVDEFALLTERTVQAWECIGLTNIPTDNFTETFAEYCRDYTFSGTDGNWEGFVAPNTVPLTSRNGMAGDVIATFENIFDIDLSITLGAFVGFVSNPDSSDISSLRFWVRKGFSCRVAEEAFCEHGPQGLGMFAGAFWTFLIVVGVQLIFLAIFTVNPLTARISLVISFFLFFMLAYIFSPFCFFRTTLLWPLSSAAWFEPILNTPVLGLLFKAGAIPVLPGCLPVELYCGFIDPLRADCIQWDALGLGGLTDPIGCPTADDNFEREFLDCSADPFNMVDLRVVTFWLQRKFPSLIGSGSAFTFMGIIRIFTPSAARPLPFTEEQLEDEEFLSCARLRGPLNIALVVMVVAFIGPILFALLLFVPLLLLALLYLLDLISDLLTSITIEGAEFTVTVEVDLPSTFADLFQFGKASIA